MMAEAPHLTTAIITMLHAASAGVARLPWPWDAAMVATGLAAVWAAGRGYRAVIMANCAAGGWYLSLCLWHWSMLAAIAAALAGTVFGLLAAPVMRVAVVLGAAALGCAAGLTLWRWFHQPPDLHWAPAVVGVVLMAIAGLYLFRAGVVVLCMLEGAVLLAAGGFGLLWRVGPVAWRAALARQFIADPFGLPALVLIITCLGLWGEYWRRKRAEAAELPPTGTG